MAVNLEAIRKRISEMNGQGKNSRVQLWKPEPGEYKVRCVPWKATPDGMPFLERKFYYIGDQPRILSPSQFGKPDPVNDLIRKCYSTNNAADRELAKKLYPKTTAYAAIVVRGQEEKGVMVWSMNPFIHQRLLSFWTKADLNGIDIIDPDNAFDLDVVVTKSKKMFNGKAVNDTVVDAARNSTKLSNDPDLAKKWIDSVPNIDDMYTQKTTAEIEQMLSTWLAGGAASDDKGNDGSTRGENKSQDVLDQLVDEVKKEVKAPVAEASAKPAEKTSRKKGAAAANVDLDDAPSSPKQSLDDAFDEIMEEDS